MSIHPTAIVAEGAKIPASCTVGPYCTIGANVVLGEDASWSRMWCLTAT